MIKALVVYGCRDGAGLPACPFAGERVCEHPAPTMMGTEQQSIVWHVAGWDVDEEHESMPSPDWCPLREQPLLIELMKGRHNE